MLGASSMSTADISAVGGGTCPFTVNGTLEPGDLTETPRLFREEPPSSCAAPQPCQGPSGTGPYFYDQYTFVNAAATNCVTVSLSSSCGPPGDFSVHASAYLGSFNPGAGTLCDNYLADIGNSPANGDPPKEFSFDVAPGATFVIVVNHVTVDATCPAPGYDLTVTGCEGVPVTLQGFAVE
jgi:hypothetical protein